MESHPKGGLFEEERSCCSYGPLVPQYCLATVHVVQVHRLLRLTEHWSLQGICPSESRVLSLSLSTPRLVCSCSDGLSGSPEPCVSLMRMTLTAGTVLSRMFHCFKRLCPPWGLQPSD